MSRSRDKNDVPAVEIPTVRSFESAPEVEARRSKRRTRTVSAFREDGRIVVAIPARMTRAQEREWVARMVAQLERKEARRKPTDLQLEERAADLNRRYLGGRAVPSSVQWSGRQRKRWGSCTPADRSIRLSTRLHGMPAWVVDYVLVHELTHLLHANHDADFWAEVAKFPHHERAKAFLDGVSWADQNAERRAGGHDIDDELPEDFDGLPEDGGLLPEGDECARLEAMYPSRTPAAPAVDPARGGLW